MLILLVEQDSLRLCHNQSRRAASVQPASKQVSLQLLLRPPIEVKERYARLLGQHLSKLRTLDTAKRDL